MMMRKRTLQFGGKAAKSGGVTSEAMASVGRNLARADNQGMKAGGKVRGTGAQTKKLTFGKNG